MGTRPEEFFESFVLGNFEDFSANPGCVRRAFNAAVSASHLADHFLSFNARHDPHLVNGFRTIGTLTEHISSRTGGAFRDIRSISNAYKHLYTDSDPRTATYSSVTSSGTVDVVFDSDEADIEGVETHFFDGGDEGDKGRVIYTRKDGTQGDLLSALSAVIAYWQEEFSK